MQILIAYAGKTGTTEKCAGVLGQKLNNVTIINLATQDVDITKYDLIIIGSSIRIGMLHSEVKKFIRKNTDILKTKKVGYYICCGFVNNYREYFEKNIAKELLDSAIIYDTFGGEMDISKQKGFDKFIVSLVSKTEEGKKGTKILTENIDKFIEIINRVLAKL